jgi:hypothetical protein
MPIVRGVPHAQMSVAQVRLEGLVGNPSVADANGRQYTSQAALPAALRPRQCLGEVPQQDLPLLKLPAPWPAAVVSQQPPAWEVHEAGAVVRHMQGQQASWYRVGAGRELVSMPSEPGLLHGPWHSACVVEVPHTLIPQQKVKYLCGRYEALEVDPSVWRVGATPLLQYTVRTATGALVMLQCKDAPGWLQGRGVRPKLCGLACGGRTGARGLGSGGASSSPCRQRPSRAPCAALSGGSGCCRLEQQGGHAC